MSAQLRLAPALLVALLGVALALHMSPSGAGSTVNPAPTSPVSAVGGVAITGGRGTLVGTLIGVALLGTIGTALTFGGIKFHVMALFGEHADRLYDYVKQSGGATESRPGSADTAVSAREQRIRDALED